MMGRSLSKIVLGGGIGIFFLFLGGCLTPPPPEEETVWTLIDRGETFKAQEYFRGKVDVHSVDGRGRTPLIAAADVQDDSLAAFLIALGANPGATDKQNRSALGITTLKHDASTAKVLVAAGANIHQPLSSGGSPARIALSANDPVSWNYLEAILTAASIQSTDAGGRTVLHLAAEAGHFPAVERILAINPSVLMKADDSGATALDIALEKTESEDHAEIAALLIQAGARSAKPLYEVFGPAVRKADYDLRLSDGSTPLHYTAREGYTGYMVFLIDHGAEVNAKNISGSTPLHEAARSGNTAAISLLIAAKAELDAQDAKGNTPLHIAIPPEAHARVLELFLSKGANPNIRDDHGETPLHIAVILNRSPEVLGALINAGAGVSTRNSDGKTPLYLAVEQSRLTLIPPLLAQRADLFAADNGKITPLEQALGKNNGELLAALITGETMTQIDSGGNTPLHVAVKDREGKTQEDPAVIRLMLSQNAPVTARNKEGETALHLAVRQNDQKAGELLLAWGKEHREEAVIFAPNAQGESPLFLSFPPAENPRRWMLTQDTLSARDGLGNTALHYAAQWKKDSQLQWLIEQGAARDAANAAGETPLFMAAKANSRSTVKGLLDAGASRDSRDRLGNTALHTAVRWNAKNAVEALLAEGLDPNSRALNGRAPLHEAVQLNYPDLERILIKGGADKEIRDNEGNTPLMEAIRGRSFQSVERLVTEHGAEPLTSNVRGDTPLHLAVSTEQDQTIRFLLQQQGASIHTKNALGKSPFQIALTRPVPETAARLVSILISQGRVSSPDNQGAFPLHIAIAGGASHPMIQLILDAGARLTDIDAEGCTPLRIAINRNDWVLAKTLAGAGSDVFFSAGDGKNPAEIAIAQGGEAVEALFSPGTINNRDASGNTVLHYAARMGNPSLVGHLISQGARKDLRNIAGEGPADIARRWRRDQELVSLLSE
jgi:ankyrin repeat protein